jgi:hypothetical protein
LQRLVHGWVSVNEWKDIDHCDRDSNEKTITF